MQRTVHLTGNQVIFKCVWTRTELSVSMLLFHCYLVPDYVQLLHRQSPTRLAEIHQQRFCHHAGSEISGPCLLRPFQYEYSSRRWYLSANIYLCITAHTVPVLGNRVTVTVDTLYPFSDTITTTITAAKKFTYYVRIPAWISKGTISVNNAAPKAVWPSNGLQAISIPPGRTRFTLHLPADITTGRFLASAKARMTDRSDRVPPPRVCSGSSRALALRL